MHEIKVSKRLCISLWPFKLVQWVREQLLVQVQSSSFLNLRCQIICEWKLLSYYLAKITSTKNSPRSSLLILQYTSLFVVIPRITFQQCFTTRQLPYFILWMSISSSVHLPEIISPKLYSNTQFVILHLHNIMTVPSPKIFHIFALS